MPCMHHPIDTIAAIATAAGDAGIAVIRISGPDSRGIAARVFIPRNGGRPSAFRGYSIHYGRFVSPLDGAMVDDGLLTVFREPASYTGEDSVELSCHGGRTTTRRVLEAALSAGARMAEPGEFTLRAFLNGRLDLAQAEAVSDVIRARTESARRAARNQLDGALSYRITAIKEEMIGILAAIEVTIDFSEEVGELQYAPLLARISSARAALEELLATAEHGRILREGLRIAIVGRPNVGKSSLLNALLRCERAIVTPIPGTTRDLVEESANIGGLPVVLIDTAGLRETSDIVEQIGVERAREAAAASAILLFVIDASTGVTEEDQILGMGLAKRDIGRVLLVVNKSDMASPTRTDFLLADAQAKIGLSFSETVVTSAGSGAGIAEMEAAIVRIAVGDKTPEAAMAEDEDSVMVSNVRHREALSGAHASLLEAERTASLMLPGDFVAIDVRGALNSLGLITGETVTDDIIHRIFRDFCVGK